MPTYEYECDRCGTFEVEQKISDPPLTTCELPCREERCAGPPGHVCGGNLKRLVAGQTGFVLNGKGWFKDGY